MSETLTISVEQAGELLGIGRDAAYQAVRAGTIPALRIGRYWRVPRSALLRMIDGQAGPKAPEAA